MTYGEKYKHANKKILELIEVSHWEAVRAQLRPEAIMKLSLCEECVCVCVSVWPAANQCIGEGMNVLLMCAECGSTQHRSAEELTGFTFLSRLRGA